MDDPNLTWDDVFTLWNELRDIAQRLLQREEHAHSIQPTELVLTALRRQKRGGWTVPFDQAEVTWENRSQFFGQVHRAMTQALIDRTRKRKGKRQTTIVPLDHLDPADFREKATQQTELLDALARAMETMRQSQPDWVDLVAYRLWEGLTNIEAARLLGVSPRTAKRWWDQIRLWLTKEVNVILAKGEN
jgi:hypothetical protein